MALRVADSHERGRAKRGLASNLAAPSFDKRQHTLPRNSLLSPVCPSGTLTFNGALRISRTRINRQRLARELRIGNAAYRPECPLPARAREEMLTEIDKMRDHGTHGFSGQVFGGCAI